MVLGGDRVYRMCRFTQERPSVIQLLGGCHPCGVRLFRAVIALRLSVFLQVTFTHTLQVSAINSWLVEMDLGRIILWLVVAALSGMSRIHITPWENSPGSHTEVSDE